MASLTRAQLLAERARTAVALLQVLSGMLPPAVLLVPAQRLWLQACSAHNAPGLAVMTGELLLMHHHAGSAAAVAAVVAMRTTWPR